MANLTLSQCRLVREYEGYDLPVGEALDSLAYGAVVYLSNTDGTLADTAGTVSKKIGVVVPALATVSTPDKLLLVEA
jgi:tetrahydromethanopterin S-methyltransferase subunit E